MKKFFMLLFLATATSFVSCNKDDDNTKSTAELLVGSWQFTQDGTMEDDTEMLEAYEHQAPGCGLDYMEFKSNNTGTIYGYYYNSECETNIELFTYSVNDNNFSFIYTDGYTLEATVLSIDSSSLKFKITTEIEGVTYISLHVLTRK